MSANGANPTLLTHLRHQRAIFAVMHSGVRVQRCGNVRPLSLRRGAHEAMRVHRTHRRHGRNGGRSRRAQQPERIRLFKHEWNIVIELGI
jgi:hypothetical protein